MKNILIGKKKKKPTQLSVTSYKLEIPMVKINQLIIGLDWIVVSRCFFYVL